MIVGLIIAIGTLITIPALAYFNRELVEKIISLMNRNKGRDLFDVWFLLEKNVEINKNLFYKKTTSKFKLEKIPTKQEYERDIEKLSDRVIPYNQIIQTMKKRLENNL